MVYFREIVAFAIHPGVSKDSLQIFAHHNNRMKSTVAIRHKLSP